MKKSSNSSELAARLTAAARQLAGMNSVPTSPQGIEETEAKPVSAKVGEASAKGRKAKQKPVQQTIPVTAQNAAAASERGKHRDGCKTTFGSVIYTDTRDLIC